MRHNALWLGGVIGLLSWTAAPLHGGLAACGHIDESCPGDAACQDGDPCNGVEECRGTCCRPDGTQCDVDLMSQAACAGIGWEWFGPGTCFCGTPVQCPNADNDLCTVETCDPDDGCQVTSTIGLECDTPPLCRAPGDGCDPDTGGCVYPPLPEGTACTPETAPPGCTTFTCDGAGNCVNRCTGTCDDEEPCTTDSGTPPNCFHDPVCTQEDGRVCTDNECHHSNGVPEGYVCVQDLLPGYCLIDGECYTEGDSHPDLRCRTCDPAANPNDWTLVPAGTSCSPLAAPPCSGAFTCDESGGCVCTTCDDDDPCTDDSGTPPNCAHDAVCTAEDGLTCTTTGCEESNGVPEGYVCTNTLQSGYCLIGGVCYSNGDRNPFNPCEECRSAVNPNDWTFLVAGSPCAPAVGGECLINGRCNGQGVCSLEPHHELCVDDDPCTTGVCRPNGCSHDPIVCEEDGVDCTYSQCQECDPNTDDGCFPDGHRCVQIPNHDFCDMGLFCLVGTCDPDPEEGGCTAVSRCPPMAPMGCLQRNVSCDEVNDMCVDFADDAQCGDEDPCDGIETCDPETGECVEGKPVSCDDENACTLDYCLYCDPNDDGCPPEGYDCVHLDDENCDGCNSDDKCNDGNICNGTHFCNLASGECLPDEPPLTCDDGLFCNGVETCDPVKGCQPARTCNSGVVAGDECEVDEECWDSICERRCAGGNNAGLPCTGQRRCVGGSQHLQLCSTDAQCPGGRCADDCFDGSQGVCDMPRCVSGAHPGLVCQSLADCNTERTCGGPDCDDGIACTIDSCDEAADGCVHTPNHGLCSDGLFCNGVEKCDPVVGCRPGPPPPCGRRGCDEANDRCRGPAGGSTRLPGRVKDSD